MREPHCTLVGDVGFSYPAYTKLTPTIAGRVVFYSGAVPLIHLWPVNFKPCLFLTLFSMQLFSRFRKSALNSVRTMTTIADIRRVSAKSLSEKILDEREAKETTFAIVDVRDDGKSARHPCGSPSIPPTP